MPREPAGVGARLSTGLEGIDTPTRRHLWQLDKRMLFGPTDGFTKEPNITFRHSYYGPLAELVLAGDS
jgi:hypothetical protein